MELAGLFPEAEKFFWEKVFQNRKGHLSEIRLRAGKEAHAYFEGKEYFIARNGDFTGEKKRARVFEKSELEMLLLHLCKYSPYAYEEELREGYLTLEGGHRVGVAGRVVMKNGEIQMIRNITFINLRVSHQFIGIADQVLPWIYDNGVIKNTLIVSPPGCGKTTLLRDMIRQISDGNPYGEGRKVGVVDERAEIGGNYLGIPQNDLGSRTDVMEGCPKMIGMSLLIRSMSPEVLAVDELGKAEEWMQLEEAGKQGVKIMATIHGDRLEEVKSRDRCRMFQEFILLGKKNGIPCILDHSDG